MGLLMKKKVDILPRTSPLSCLWPSLALVGAASRVVARLRFEWKTCEKKLKAKVAHSVAPLTDHKIHDPFPPYLNFITFHAIV